MPCVKNRIYCHDCNRSYIDSNYSNHLRSQGHIDNLMKKRCCSCDSTITQYKSCCNNHDITQLVSKLSLKSNDNTQIDFSNKQDNTRKQSNKYNNIDPDILLEIYRKKYSGCNKDKESIVEARAILSELYRIDAITWREYIEFLYRN